jgi:hypothetical protein
MVTPPAPGQRLSVIEAAQSAIELTKQRLFPFRLERWLPLGFVTFLDHCGRKGGGGGSYQVPGGGPDGTGSGVGGVDLSSVRDWIGEHLIVIVAVSAILLVLVVALTALILWINSRGVFMYLDNVATGRFDVKRPWHEHRERAWSYFTWSFGATLVGLFGVLLLLVPIGLLVWSLITEGASCAPIGGIVAIGLIFLAFVIALQLFSVLLRDFAAPLQLALGVPCGYALGVAWGLVKGNVASFVAYVALKIVFAIAAGIVGLVAGCVTCCLGFLPVISHTLLQPVHYFERAWSLFLLRQAGYDLFPAAPVAPLPAAPPDAPPALP